MSDPACVVAPTPDVRVLTLAALVKLRDEGPTDVRLGICGNANANVTAAFRVMASADAHAYAVARGSPVSEMLCYGYSDGDIFRTIYEVAREWPRHSGDDTYPVPHPWMEAEEGFDSCGALWAGVDYGGSRRELLDYLIEELTNRTAVTPAPER